MHTKSINIHVIEHVYSTDVRTCTNDKPPVTKDYKTNANPVTDRRNPNCLLKVTDNHCQKYPVEIIIQCSIWVP